MYFNFRFETFCPTIMILPIEVKISDGTFLRGEGDYDEKTYIVTLSSQLIAGIAVKIAGIRGIGVTAVAVINGKREPLRSQGSVWRLANPPQTDNKKTTAKAPSDTGDAPEQFKVSGSVKWMW